MEYLRTSIDTDLRYVADNMREEDIAEVKAFGYTPFDALLSGYHLPPCYTLVDPEGKPAGMLGVSYGGQIWLLGTPSIERYSMRFLRHSKPVLQRLYEETGYELFWNYTHKPNHLHHKWLKWLGFSFLREVGEFYEFARLRG